MPKEKLSPAQITGLREGALELAALGFPVFPVESRGKEPIGRLVPNGHKDAITDPAKIDGCWRHEAPGANIGLALPPDIVVIDVDPRNGGDESFETIEGNLPDTLTCLTGGGGQHLYFRIPPDTKLPGKLAKGIDLKKHGGYVIAPPSIHPSGKEYLWANEGTPIANAPAWLLEFKAKPAEPIVSAAPTVEHSRSAELCALSMLIEPHFTAGKRNEIRLRGAGMLRHAGYSIEDAEMLFVDLLPPKDGQTEKARAAVHRSYETTTATGFGRFAELLENAVAGEQIKAIVGARESVMLDEIGPPKQQAEPPSNGFADIWSPQPPIPWVVEGLELAPGAPTLIVGYGFSGKTLALQSAALSIAAGKAVWSMFPAKQGRVLHLDYEQGQHTTARRYQRLARALGVWDVAGLDVLIAPRIKLDGDEDAAHEELVRLSDGRLLVIVDSLRAAAPSLEENSSDIRRPLDLLFSVSESTGAAFAVIHHAGKGERPGREKARGSSALFDACQAMLSFEPVSEAPGAPVKVTNEKARVSGRRGAPVELKIEDVAQGIEPAWGLRVSAAEPVRKDALADLDSALLRAVGENPGSSGRRLERVVGGKAKGVRDALQDMADRGLVYHQERHSDEDGRKLPAGWFVMSK